MPATTAIVILNWNGKAYLQQFLPSVLETQHDDYSVILADNASTDDSVDFVQQNFPSVKIIRLAQNYGFAGGYNEALKQVDAKYYILLNSDVEVTPDWLAPLVQLLDSDPRIAACQPKLLSYAHRHLFEYAGAAGGWLDAFGYPFGRGRVFDVCETDTGQFNDSVPVFWASGAAMAIRAQAFHAMNGFDSFFFAHQEEIDLCWRLQLAGYRIFACGASTVYHVGGGTLPKGASRKTFLNFRNNHIMLAKNLPLAQKWWKIPVRLALDQAAAWKGLLSGDPGYFATIYRAHFAFIGWLFKKGKNISRNRVPLEKLEGVYPKLVIWDYFIRKRGTFRSLRS